MKKILNNKKLLIIITLSIFILLTAINNFGINGKNTKIAVAEEQTPTFTNFFVFGDSLSDVGNFPNNGLYNFGGRYSNGKVWNEYLAELLEINTPKKSTDWSEGKTVQDGFNNFAYGGATSSYNSSVNYYIETLNIDVSDYTSYTAEQILRIKPLNKQISDDKSFSTCFDRYNYTFTDTDLIAIWGGANDFLINPLLRINLISASSAGENAGNYMATNIETLISKYNAKNILAFTLPDISRTSRYMASDEQQRKNAHNFSYSFYNVFSKNITELQIKYPNVNFYVIDVYNYFNQIIDNYNGLGFTYYTETVTNHGGTVEQQSKYMFYDGVHPSTKLHELFANIIYNNFFNRIKLENQILNCTVNKNDEITLDFSCEGFPSNPNLSIEWLNKNKEISANLIDGQNKIKINVGNVEKPNRYLFRLKGINELTSQMVYSDYFIINVQEQEIEIDHTPQYILIISSAVLIGLFIVSVISFRNKTNK